MKRVLTQSESIPEKPTAIERFAAVNHLVPEDLVSKSYLALRLSS